jgi:hypothetical protein
MKGIIMKHSKLFMAICAALALSAAALAPAVNAANDEVVQGSGGVAHVSGGVGLTSIERLNAISRDFNLKLVFAMASGNYVDGVTVTIANSAGRTLVDAASDGPWFLARLPAGTYQVTATFAGKTEKRSVTVGAEKLTTADFRWASE